MRCSGSELGRGSHYAWARSHLFQASRFLALGAKAEIAKPVCPPDLSKTGKTGCCSVWNSIFEFMQTKNRFDRLADPFYR
jgi:hypothetical protein